jgi:Zn-dependent peptidase ImmA (M78 family)
MENNELEIVALRLNKFPVRLQSIFDDLDIRYEELWMDDGASGSITRRGDKFSITVNATESEARKRFTAAHELAHYLLHRDLMSSDGDKMHRHTDRLFGAPEDNPASPFTRQHEVQANRLAAQIVMPGPLVRERFAVCSDAGVLASEFQVSEVAMRIRLKTLGLMA